MRHAGRNLRVNDGSVRNIRFKRAHVAPLSFTAWPNENDAAAVVLFLYFFLVYSSKVTEF